MTMLYAVIEAGGTKFNCALVTEQRDIVAQTRITTTTPKETLAQTIAFFEQQKHAGLAFSQMGLATFGPVDLSPKSPTFGSITTTPKPGWKNTPLVSTLSSALSCDIYLDTDVNAAALAEYRWGAAQDTDVSIYVTIGTGVGAGIVINGRTLKGLLHPEIGHLYIGEVDGIQGVCPYHGSCIEGLAAGASMHKIWHAPPETLSDNHPAWDIQAKVLAKLVHNLMISFSPQRIAIGGGVMAKNGLLENTIRYAETSLNGYLAMPNAMTLSDIVTAPGLGDKAGLLGALALVLEA